MRAYAQEAGRDPASIGIEGRVNLTESATPDLWAEKARAWKDLGATHVSLNTMRVGLKSPQDHIDAIRQFKEAVEA